YGACAATYDSALGPSHAPACTSASNAMSSSAADVYSALNELHTPAAASRDPGPGPLLSSAECTSGGEAIQMGDNGNSSGWRHYQTEQSLMNMIVVINVGGAPPARARPTGGPS